MKPSTEPFQRRRLAGALAALLLVGCAGQVRDTEPVPETVG
jgi:hypothetical protein